MIIQSLFGQAFVSVIPNRGHCYEFKAPEIKGTVIGARFDNGVAMAITNEGGKYIRHVFRFHKDYSGYDHWQVDIQTPAGLNFVTLDKGVCCLINESGEMELFAARPGVTAAKKIVDPVLSGDMSLIRNGDDVMFIRGKELYSLKMR